MDNYKDMVVLKRNDVGDATHTDHNKFKYYVGSESYLMTTDGWTKVTLDHDLIKPIEKKEMKKFLVNHDGKWTLQLLDADTEENSYRVAVPSGADVAYFFSASDLMSEEDDIAFYKNSLNFIFQDDGGWEENGGNIEFIKNKGEILWQRSEIEPLSDQCVGIEEFRQSTIKVTIDELKHRVNDKVNNPSHYSDSTIECIDAMEAMLSPQEFIGYLRGNMFKYQWRYQKKNGIEDLQKSEWYLKKLIEVELEKN